MENLNQLLKTDGSNPFKDLQVKMQFPRAVLSKDLRILESLNKGEPFIQPFFVEFDFQITVKLFLR